MDAVKQLLHNAGVTAKITYEGMDTPPFDTTQDRMQMDKWAVYLRRRGTRSYLRTTYWTGLEHREGRDVVTPRIADIINSLLLDASAREYDFTGWCRDYGYNADSRTAFRIYTRCVQTYAALRRVFNDTEMDALRTATEGL